MHCSRVILTAALACTTLAAPAPTAATRSLKDLLTSLTPQVEKALNNNVNPIQAKDKLHSTIGQVQELVPLLPTNDAAVALTRRNTPSLDGSSLKDIFGFLRPQVEKALGDGALPQAAKDKLLAIVNEVQDLVTLLPETPISLIKRDGNSAPASLREMFGFFRPHINTALLSASVPEEAKEKLSNNVDQVQGLIPLLPAPSATDGPFAKRQTKSKLTKPADYDDPNFARVVLDDAVNEMYRIAMVNEYKQTLPSMNLTQELFEEVTAELSFLAISHDPAQENRYCKKVKEEVDDMEFIYEPETLQNMCETQQQALIAAHEEEERLHAEKDEKVRLGDLVGADAVAHKLADLLKKEEEHAKHGSMERKKWISKQQIRAKFEDAVAKGLRPYVYDVGK